jgi:tRNA threonylcarbamoyl adenosine modification protein (Sua5/YciO/YrdC/YwlC family)
VPGALRRATTPGVMAVAPIVEIDPQHPQPRLVERAVQALSSGGLVAFPTDTYYGIGCDLFDKRAIERIYQLKQLPKTHELSFICLDLAEVARYAVVDNAAYRVLRRKTPGPFTFILPATRLVPDLVLRRQKTVGIRVPDSPIALALVRQLAHPLISTSAATPGGEVLIDAKDIKEQLGHGLDLVLDGGYKANEPSSVIDLTGPEPVVVRQGKGDTSDLLQ